MAIVAVLMTCFVFTSCDNKTDEELYSDYGKNIAGTWAYCQDGIFEVLTINADGTLLSNGVEDGESWLGIKGFWSLEKNKLVMIFDDDHNFEGTVEVVAGKTLTMINSTDNSRAVYCNAESSLPVNFVGTWSVVGAEYAEVLQISADGSVVSAGLEGTEDYWDNVNGKIVVLDNFISMTFEDNDDFVGQYELVDKETFVLVDVQTGERITYNYCKNDLSDEILGTWENIGSQGEDKPDFISLTFKEDGDLVYRYFSLVENEFVVDEGYTYKVIGDLLIRITPKIDADNMIPQYTALRLVYSPDKVSGDTMAMISYLSFENEVLESIMSFLRVDETVK